MADAQTMAQLISKMFGPTGPTLKRGQGARGVHLQETVLHKPAHSLARQSVPVHHRREEVFRLARSSGGVATSRALSAPPSSITVVGTNVATKAPTPTACQPRPTPPLHARAPRRGRCTAVNSNARNWAPAAASSARRKGFGVCHGHSPEACCVCRLVEGICVCCQQQTVLGCGG